jgi:hypothetical protein
VTVVCDREFSLPVGIPRVALRQPQHALFEGLELAQGVVQPTLDIEHSTDERVRGGKFSLKVCESGVVSPSFSFGI